MNIGIIGLGKMGLNIALNLNDHQYSVKGYDLNEQAFLNVKEKGLEVYSEMSDF